MTARPSKAEVAKRRAALHAQLREEVAADSAPLMLDEERYEPVPPDQQQLPPHRVREEQPRELPWHQRDN